MKHKKLFIALMAVFSALVALATFITIWLWGDTYPDFDNDFDVSVAIPGLKDDAVPQGIANYSGDEDYFFISAYMKKGPSRIYVTGAKTGYVGYVTLKNEDGSDYTGHCGGVATNGGTLWLTSDDTVFVAKRSSNNYVNIASEVIEKSKLTDGENVISFTSSFAANCNASFCYYYDAPNSTNNDCLYVGEFYKKDKYETAADHRVTTKISEEQNTAFVYEYRVNTGSTNIYGLDTLSGASTVVPEIKAIYSITGEIQGFARTENGVVLSSSWGLKNSTLYYHDWTKIRPSTGVADYRTAFNLLTGHNFEYEGLTTPNGVKYTDSSLYVYFIDSSSLIREYSIPSMSEGLCVTGDRVHVLFESASYKYKLFVRRRMEEVYYFVPRK